MRRHIMKTTAEVRQSFLRFFKSKGHQIVPSSSLVPENDPTLLFTNAGMNQFKETFLGVEKREYTRATTAQRCVRAGGKHNDLENVGYTARHHTFFEMLGNFSFGDYFKNDAISFAWEFLTSPQWLNLPKERLWVTVYESDQEAYEIWLNDIGVPAERIVRIGDNKGAPYASDNFWQMGDTGPCGPCTEIFFDHGDHIWGGPPGSPDEDGDRYIEIWNVVFMQFNRQSDGTMSPLPKPSVDTGMGLERITAVLQHVNSNYDIDIFQTLIGKTAELLAVTDKKNKSLYVIADHIRSCAYLIADGVMPSNEGRGYVLRRIIRRAVRHGHMLGAKGAFFYQLVTTLIDVMAEAGNELKEKKTLIETQLKREEEQFARTLERGLVLLDDALKNVKNGVLAGDVAFKLYDTYGFPLDLTADVCREKNIKVDEDGFNKEMDAQRQRAQSASNFGVDYSNVISVDSQTKFDGYNTAEALATVVAIFKDEQRVEQISAGDDAIVILDNTPFYAESGGQIGDIGQLASANLIFNVNDTQKYGQVFGHIGQLEKGILSVGDTINAVVNETRRQKITLNHSATHLLHAALRQLLGDHVTQKGSLVSDEMLRFDFSHPESISREMLNNIEALVNKQVRANYAVETELMDIDAAKEKGVMALFGEKYSDEVRVLSMGDFSTELCGGIHANRTGDIGLFKIRSEGAIASGIRRIEAITGETALEWVHHEESVLQKSSALLKSDSDSLAEKITALQERSKKLEKALQETKQKMLIQASGEFIAQRKTFGGVNVILQSLQDVDNNGLRILVDDLKNQLGKGIVAFIGINGDKLNLIAGVTQDLTSTVRAGELVNLMATQVGGKGGGRPDLAMAGGTQVENVDRALEVAEKWLIEQLAK